MLNVALGLLRHRKRQNEILYPDSPWVFPAASKSGHIVEPKEQRQIGGKKVAILPSPHRLRDTYTTACVEADLSPYDIDVLINHRPPKGTVTAGYIRQNVDHLQKCQEKVSSHLLKSVRNRRYREAKAWFSRPRDHRLFGRSLGMHREGASPGAPVGVIRQGECVFFAIRRFNFGDPGLLPGDPARGDDDDDDGRRYGGQAMVSMNDRHVWNGSKAAVNRCCDSRPLLGVKQT
jgi:hypothetical protein